MDSPGLDDLLNHSSLPSMLIMSDINNTFTEQAGAELSRKKFSPESSFENETIEVSSQDFLEGLAKSKGRRTSSRHCLLAGDDGRGLAEYSFTGLSSNSSDVSNVFSSKTGIPSNKCQSPREEAHNSSLPRVRPRRTLAQESCHVNIVQRKEASFTAIEEVSSTKPEAPVGHRRKFLPKEDSQLVKFFLTEGCYGERKGVAVWKRIAAEDVCPGRTWQSLKERFLKRILPNLPKFKVTENALLQAADRSKNKSSSKRYSREEDSCIIRFFLTQGGFKDTKGVAVWKRMAAEGVCPGRTWQSLKERFLKRTLLRNRLQEFKVTEDALLQAANRSKNKSSSKWYSREEDSQFIRFFLTQGSFKDRKGVTVWKRMAAEGVCPGRTWQSLKERFLKRILLRNRLQEFKVTEEDLLQAADKLKKSQRRGFLSDSDEN